MSGNFNRESFLYLSVFQILTGLILGFAKKKNVVTN